MGMDQLFPNCSLGPVVGTISPRQTHTDSSAPLFQHCWQEFLAAEGGVLSFGGDVGSSLTNSLFDLCLIILKYVLLNIYFLYIGLPSGAASQCKALHLSARGVTTGPGLNSGCITSGCDWKSHRAAHRFGQGRPYL
jgi:hypothetical protein